MGRKLNSLFIDRNKIVASRCSVVGADINYGSGSGTTPFNPERNCLTFSGWRAFCGIVSNGVIVGSNNGFFYKPCAITNWCFVGFVTINVEIEIFRGI